MNKEQILDLHNALQDWHKSRIEGLQSVVEGCKDGVNICFETQEGDKVNLPDKHRTGFQYGVMCAIEMFKEFPITISETETNE